LAKKTSGRIGDWALPPATQKSAMTTDIFLNMAAKINKKKPLGIIKKIMKTRKEYLHLKL